MADQDGRHSEMITQLPRHVTSSPNDAHVKGDIFGRTICPPSLVIIAFLFSELRWGALPLVVEDRKKPGLNKVTPLLLGGGAYLILGPKRWGLFRITYFIFPSKLILTLQFSFPPLRQKRGGGGAIREGGLRELLRKFSDFFR